MPNPTRLAQSTSQFKTRMDIRISTWNIIHQTIQRQQQSAGKHAHIPEQSVQPRHAMQQYMDHRHISWFIASSLMLNPTGCMCCRGGGVNLFFVPLAGSFTRWPDTEHQHLWSVAFYYRVVVVVVIVVVYGLLLFNVYCCNLPIRISISSIK